MLKLYILKSYQMPYTITRFKIKSLVEKPSQYKKYRIENQNSLIYQQHLKVIQ